MRGTQADIKDLDKDFLPGRVAGDKTMRGASSRRCGTGLLLGNNRPSALNGLSDQ
jgi:hypothetical protein